MVFLFQKEEPSMRSVIFFKRNKHDGKVVPGEFSSVGTISVTDGAIGIPLDETEACWVPENKVEGEDQEAQEALAELIRQNDSVGFFLLRLVEHMSEKLKE